MSKRVRVADHGIVFAGPCDTSVGWHIPVPAAFREQLDIQWTAQKGVSAWTQGVPPQYTLAAGGVFYDPPEVRSMAWGEALPHLCQVLQIEKAAPDTLDGDGLVSGWVIARLDRYFGGRLWESERIEATQQGFVRFLRDGAIEPHERIVRVSIQGDPRWLLEYADADGVVTERAVRARVVTLRQGRLYLDSFCEMAQSLRSFRLDRIRTLTDLATGEVVDAPLTWIVERHAKGLEQAAAKPIRKPVTVDQLKERLKRGLRALLALAVADGPLSEAKMEVLAAYVQARCDMLGIQMPGAPRNVVDLLVGRMRPSREVAEAALRKQAGCDGPRWLEHHAVLLTHAARLALAGAGGEAAQVILDVIAAAANVEPAGVDG